MRSHCHFHSWITARQRRESLTKRLMDTHNPQVARLKSSHPCDTAKFPRSKKFRVQLLLSGAGGGCTHVLSPCLLSTYATNNYRGLGGSRSVASRVHENVPPKLGPHLLRDYLSLPFFIFGCIRECFTVCYVTQALGAPNPIPHLVLASQQWAATKQKYLAPGEHCYSTDGLDPPTRPHVTRVT